ncbi:hypothetical protein FHN55_15690 [Streptomyces sp. NP160]|uniref:hypothetical protein n=1 Tax=Streptomyces sp. NP160 TaxID=2586637 RepID=UPI00111ADB2A|nr:hypothetical protein [Streptomyces sp. NP160]TNM63269.1 hypothetical protein FHN55_15690 [Streptomyces sp. NP160]
MTEAPSTSTLVLTRGWLPGVRTARVVVDGGPPERLRAGQVLALALAPGPHEVRVVAGGARSHLHRVVLALGQVRELEVGTSWPDALPGTAPVPALLDVDDRTAPIAWRDGVPLDESQWPFWSFVLGFVAPPVGLVVAALALRRPGLSSVSRGLVVAGLLSGACYVLAFAVGVVWVLTADV